MNTVATRPTAAAVPSTTAVGQARTGAETDASRGVTSAAQLPAMVPARMATSDARANSPFAAESLGGGTISGIAPTTAGVISAAWVPIAITVPKSSQRPSGSPSHSRPAPASRPTTTAAAAAISTSTTLHQRMTVVFECRSASAPASQEKRTYGSDSPTSPMVMTRDTSAISTNRLPRPIASHLRA